MERLGESILHAAGSLRVAVERSGQPRYNGANGMSDMEGKVTRVGASERGQRTSFKTSNPHSYRGARSRRCSRSANGADGISDIEGKAGREAASEYGQRASFAIRPRSAFSLSQYNGIPTTTIRIAQTISTDSAFPNRAWVNWSICAAAMPRCSKIPSPFKVFFFGPILNPNSSF